MIFGKPFTINEHLFLFAGSDLDIWIVQKSYCGSTIEQTLFFEVKHVYDGIATNTKSKV